ncbi:MAG: hypothetical protein NT175_13980 [Bacteroidetes bacterium]|nr:hypothetical protein [Bacteroidota bacterium]
MTTNNFALILNKKSKVNPSDYFYASFIKNKYVTVRQWTSCVHLGTSRKDFISLAQENRLILKLIQKVAQYS